MIDEAEFERRVDQWFGLVLKAMETNIGRVVGKALEIPETDMNNPAFLLTMEEADIYRNLYLTEEILVHFLDPLMPPGYFKRVDRVDFLLQRGMAQHHAQRIAQHIIAEARIR